MKGVNIECNQAIGQLGQVGPWARATSRGLLTYFTTNYNTDYVHIHFKCSHKEELLFQNLKICKTQRKRKSILSHFISSLVHCCNNLKWI